MIISNWYYSGNYWGFFGMDKLIGIGDLEGKLWVFKKGMATKDGKSPYLEK